MEAAKELKLLKQNFEQQQSLKEASKTFESLLPLHFALHSIQRKTKLRGLRTLAATMNAELMEVKN